MIITCPACRTRFNVDERQLNGPVGRDVRCANCGHGWHQAPELHAAGPLAMPEPPTAEQARVEPPTVERAKVEPPKVEPARPEPVIGTGPIEVPRVDPAIRPVPPSEPVRRRGAGHLVGWLVLLLIVAACAYLALEARQRVVALWPPAERFYAAVGWPVEPTGTGLEISKIVPVRTPQGLVIEGEVTNISKIPHRVPRLNVALRDAGAKIVTSKIIPPPKPRLLPGEAEHFKTPFANPPDAATGVVVTFAPS